MMPLSAKDAERLPKLLGLLGSDQPGEVVNAAHAASSLLKRNKMSWADLARHGGGSSDSNAGQYQTGYTAGYRDGVRAGLKSAPAAEAEYQRGYEKGKADAAGRHQKEGPRVSGGAGTNRHWPPDDDIWFGQDPHDEVPGEYQEQIDQLNDLWKVETRLTDFEHGFVQSLAEQLLEKGRLTDRQCEVLDDVHTRRRMSRGAGR